MSLTAEQRHNLFSHPAGWIASGFGSGLSPVAPGTAGSVVALLPWLALRELPLVMYLALVFLALILGIWASSVVVQRMGLDDPGVIVWDEFVGLWIALAIVPFDWRWLLTGFFLFRLFDIWKPWPVSWADRSIKGGLGVMLDDVIAGIFTCLVMSGLIMLR